MLSKEDIGTFIKLSNIKGIRETNFKELIAKFNPISTIFSTPRKVEKIVGKKLASDIKMAQKKNVEPEISLLSKLGAELIAYNDTAYPENLQVLQDAPLFFYIKGNLLPQDVIAIAIVGSRRATHYGKQVAKMFAYEFAQTDVTVVSGMARGIDSCAHLGALEGNGRTIAVLGSGIDIIYPPENHSLANDIAKNGAYISEFPIGTQPWAGNFPARNRIIAGLSKAIVVIEAGMKSGALSTVKWALDQGKEVFAVPGNITSETSKGVNQLIMEGAQLVVHPSDVLQYLGIPLRDFQSSIKRKEEKNLSTEEKKLFNILSYEDPVSCDNIAEALNLDVAKVLQISLNLELRGLVKQLPGRQFIKNLTT